MKSYNNLFPESLHNFVEVLHDSHLMRESCNFFPQLCNTFDLRKD